MNLICTHCGKKETTGCCELDEDCYLGCGGTFIKAIPITETDPNGKDQHEPGAKMDDGKVKAGVLEDFAMALWEVARVGSNGSVKYTRRGWEKVPDGIERYNDAKWRHLLKGAINPIDPEWDILHLAHECWNNLAKLELVLREEEDNRAII